MCFVAHGAKRRKLFNNQEGIRLRLTVLMKDRDDLSQACRCSCRPSRTDRLGLYGQANKRIRWMPRR